ncbi:MAG: hypothetical protein DSY76_09425, partial [Bacteroidetes bacterium]
MKKITLVSLLLLLTQTITSQTITTFSTGYTSLYGVAVNSNNEVFVSEHDTGKVYSIDNTGTATEYASTGGGYANNIAFDSNDVLFITEPFMSKIFIKNSANPATIYVDISDAPNSLAFDDNGNLYFSTITKVVKVNHTDLSLTDYVSSFTYAEGIAFDSSGNLYIADRNGSKLFKYDGNTLTEIANNIDGIRGVAVAPDDTVYFTKYNSWPGENKILKYDPVTNTVTDYVTTNLDVPRHLAIDNSGNMYVTNLGNNTVIKIHDNSLLPVNVYIPDANFKNALLSNSNINTNGDTEIQFTEAAAYTGSIDVSNMNISDLTGIEAFTEIIELNCSANLLTSLDVTHNTQLRSLSCYNFLSSTIRISNLDVSNNTLLTNLNCRYNNLSSLDVSNSTQLTNLDCRYNN